MEKYSLNKSLRVYWLNLLAILLAPAATVAALVFFKPLFPIVFFSLGIFATVVPYHMGKAPVSYLIACQLLFVLGAFFVPLVFCMLWAAGVPEEMLNKWWTETWS
ncbi:hypothetical protein ETAA8_66150 [Anatilimnocola aggregata]|uniref:Uncharacterized protein n=1 Tax=Anatilimnocola aggregata TaxID=2528021 RepID=A0A517YMK5_9BACT|nr:hypothetical protein [Anatilimnocola aggregata]QDU31457.1 hypothetical protein ETAA8_66150 [Anatilimnocola aggregata]